jgi:hypothetical protein
MMIESQYNRSFKRKKQHATHTNPPAKGACKKTFCTPIQNTANKVILRNFNKTKKTQFPDPISKFKSITIQTVHSSSKLNMTPLNFSVQ